jgi:hypothetical protein
VFDMLMTGSGPPGVLLTIGSIAAVQVDVTGPSTATTPGSAAKALALRAHLAGLGSGEAALASSHTCTPTVKAPARQPRWARTILTAWAFWTPWSLIGPCRGPLLAIRSCGRPSPP